MFEILLILVLLLVDIANSVLMFSVAWVAVIATLFLALYTLGCGVAHAMHR